MANTGITRRIDDLGRIVIPKEIRRSLAIKEGDPLTISVEGDHLVLAPYFEGAIADIERAGAKILDCLQDIAAYQEAIDFEAYFDALMTEIQK